MLFVMRCMWFVVWRLLFCVFLFGVCCSLRYGSLCNNSVLYVVCVLACFVVLLLCICGMLCIVCCHALHVMCCVARRCLCSMCYVMCVVCCLLCVVCLGSLFIDRC